VNKLKLFIMIVIAYYLSGCSAHTTTPEIDMKAPHYVENPSAKINQKCYAHEGSVYGRGQNPIFTDRKAMHVNDIVTVVINESASQSSVGNKKISDLSQNNLGGGVFGGGVLKNLNGLTDMSFKTNSNSTYSGTGAASRNEKFQTTVTVRVVKVLRNGNYFISGSREILINGSKQIIRVAGVIRSNDIDQYNTINSKYIADAKILYENQDDIREATRRPWGSKIVDSVWPF
jgi:flagellar L-ring protein precursor FlgH